MSKNVKQHVNKRQPYVKKHNNSYVKYGHIWKLAIVEESSNEQKRNMNQEMDGANYNKTITRQTKRCNIRTTNDTQTEQTQNMNKTRNTVKEH